MRYPLDKVCVKSGVLCEVCRRKVESGVVSESELPVMRALMTLEEKSKALRKGEYVKSYTLDDEVLVMLRGEWERGELDEVAKALSDALGKRVKVIVDSADRRRIVEQVVSPASLMGVDEVWLPNGIQLVRVRISRRDKRFLRGREREYEELLSSLVGSRVRLSFE
ncbi:MAG: transcription elongation factor [Desulfurococcaceae archaeon]